ncbi:TnpV protein [Enterocloster clostridioformis]|uniref:TnpV protein n=2 Tax=Bacillota TaxID=1239 RepID=UPI003D31C4DE
MLLVRRSMQSAPECLGKSKKPLKPLNRQKPWKGAMIMNEMTYTQVGDYRIPDIELKNTETKPLGKYGRMRRAFLQENNPMLLNDLILSEQLFPHLQEIDETAHRRVEQLMTELLEKNPAPDKATQQMAWVQHMNSLKAQAEEIVTAELINS